MLLAGNFGISADIYLYCEKITKSYIFAIGNFNYAEDFVNAGNINANNLNFISAMMVILSIAL